VIILVVIKGFAGKGKGIGIATDFLCQRITGKAMLSDRIISPGLHGILCLAVRPWQNTRLFFRMLSILFSSGAQESPPYPPRLFFSGMLTTLSVF